MNKDRSINFGSLLGLSFRKWKQMLLAAILFALLAGLYKAVPLIRQNQAANRANSTKETAQKNGEEYAQDSLQAKEDYLEHSLISKINPQNEGEATADISIVFPDESGDEVVTAMGDDDDFSIFSGKRKVAETFRYYVHYIENGIDWSDLADELGTTEVYLQEIVFLDDVDYGLGTATLRVVYEDDDGAAKIRDYILDQLNAVDKNEASRYGTFSLAINNKAQGYVADPSLFTWVNNRLNEINTLSTAADTYSSNVSKLDDGSKISSGSRNTESVSAASVAGQAARYAAAGFIGGAILFILLYAIYIAAKRRVLSAEEFNGRYELNPIAIIPERDPNQLRGLDRHIIRRHANDYSSLSYDICYKIAAQNLSEMFGGKGTVALFGDIPANVLENVCGRLKRALAEEKDSAIVVETLTDLNRNPDALHRLSGCDAAVLVGRVNQSEYGDVDQLVRTVGVYDKKILGSILA